MLGFKRVLAIFAVLSALVWAGSAAVQANPNRMPLVVGDLSGNFCGKAVGPILLHIDAKEYFKTYATKDGGTRNGGDEDHPERVRGGFERLEHPRRRRGREGHRGRVRHQGGGARGGIAVGLG